MHNEPLDDEGEDADDRLLAHPKMQEGIAHLRDAFRMMADAASSIADVPFDVAMRSVLSPDVVDKLVEQLRRDFGAELRDD
jgi:hypothetical protein